jgi:hypothetical protein
VHWFICAFLYALGLDQSSPSRKKVVQRRTFALKRSALANRIPKLKCFVLPSATTRTSKGVEQNKIKAHCHGNGGW